MDTYIFARKINGTEAEGIINTKIQMVLCLCTEKNSKTILQALKISSNLPIGSNEAVCPTCGSICEKGSSDEETNYFIPKKKDGK